MDYLESIINPNKKTLFDKYQYEKRESNVYAIDVLGDGPGGNIQWRKLGEVIVPYVLACGKKVVVFSTMSLGHYLTISSDESKKLENHVNLKVGEHKYFITCIEPDQTTALLPDIMESGEFVFGLNCYLYFVSSEVKLDDLLRNEQFIKELNYMNSRVIIDHHDEVQFESINGTSMGLDMIWTNPAFKD